ncbi:unnamed protein product [Agarophyton chilense]
MTGFMPKKSPAFAIATPLAPRSLNINVCRKRSKIPQTTTTHNHRRARVSMIGPFFPDFSDSKLMKSEIVRKEMGSLERDYAELAKLGTRYETFDPRGKHLFIDSALDVVDRFAIFLTRLKLSEEFSAQMFIKQYSVRLQEYGLTIDSLIANTKRSLEMMRTEIPEV